MKTCMAVTVERNLFNLIERLRGREKRSTFVEYLLRLGLEVYKTQISSGGQAPKGTPFYQTVPSEAEEPRRIKTKLRRQ